MALRTPHSARRAALDDGQSWHRLLDTRALPSRPIGPYYNPITDSTKPELYIAFLGRGIMRCR